MASYDATYHEQKLVSAGSDQLRSAIMGIQRSSENALADPHVKRSGNESLPRPGNDM